MWSQVCVLLAAGMVVGAHQMTTRTEETVNWLLITRENVKTWVRGAR
jgi:hypothetical protein